MQSSTSVVWNVANIVKSSSRIPHLNYHLLRRRSRRLPQDAYNTIARPQRRPHSTALDLGQYDRDSYETDSISQVHRTDRTPKSSLIDRTTEQSDENVDSLAILGEDNPDRLLFALLDNTIGTPFIRYSSDEVFERVFLSLNPDYFVEPYKSIFRTLRRLGSTDRFPGIKSIEERFEEFLSHIDHIIDTRRQAGVPLTLPVCRHLLRCASSIGDAKLATTVLDSIMVADKVEPDLTCYNYYLHAMCWNHAFSKLESRHLRVTTGNLFWRAVKNPPPNLVGHQVSNPAKNIIGIRDEVLGHFKTIAESPMVPDEFTFVNLMTAMGREGDLDGVKSILSSVWKIKLDLLATYDEEEIESPSFYEDDHPLRPTERLLSSVVHTYGSNNDVRTAWVLVDYISRNYNLTIPRKVWMELLEWTFVLSLYRTASDKLAGKGAGQLPPEALAQMVRVMTDAPHNIDQNIFTHCLLARISRQTKNLRNVESHTDAAIKLFEDQADLMGILVEEVLEMLADPSLYRTNDGFLSPKFHLLRRLFLKESLDFENSRQMIQRSIRNNILIETDFPGSGKLTNWPRRLLPKLVEKYTEWLPSSFFYYIPSGVIEIECETHRLKSLRGQQAGLGRAVKIIQTSLDTEDHATLLKRAAQLRDFLSHKQTYCPRCGTTTHSSDFCPRKEVPMWAPTSRTTIQPT